MSNEHTEMPEQHDPLFDDALKEARAELARLTSRCAELEKERKELRKASLDAEVFALGNKALTKENVRLQTALALSRALCAKKDEALKDADIALMAYGSEEHSLARVVIREALPPTPP